MDNARTGHGCYYCGSPSPLRPQCGSPAALLFVCAPALGMRNGTPSRPCALGLGALFVPSHPLRHAAAALRSSRARFQRARGARPGNGWTAFRVSLQVALRPPARTLRLPRTTRLGASPLPWLAARVVYEGQHLNDLVFQGSQGTRFLTEPVPLLPTIPFQNRYGYLKIPDSFFTLASPIFSSSTFSPEETFRLASAWD